MKRKRLLPKPIAPEGGIYIRDPDTVGEVFVSWEELQQACSECIKAPDYVTGKDYYKNDPTYNARKK